MLLLLTQVFFIWGIHGFLQLSWIGLFATKWVLFHLENNGLQEIFLSQLTQFSEEYNVLDATFLPCMVVFGELHAFPPLTGIGLFGAKSAHLHRESPNFRKVFLSKVNSVITEKQCAASFCFYTDGFPSRDTCVSWSKMNWWICSQMSLFHLENFGSQEVLLSKTFWVSRDNNALEAASTFLAGFLWRDTYGSSTQENRPIWSKLRLCPPWKTTVAGSIVFLNLRNSHRKTMC
jgi:hypothetical protein